MTGKTGVACKKCGEPVPPGGRFCMSCGNDVSGQQGEAATAYMPAPSPTQQFKRGVMDALRDATLGEYEILAQLGEGGMATVFLAHDIALDRKVAIKVMSPHLLSGEGMVERFKQEARTAAGLSHPHIIPIYAVKQEGDLLFFVMKFIEGRALDEIVKEHAPLPEILVRQIISKVAEALGIAHQHGVVHRDIKPANIMIDTLGTPIVTDFGIAKVAAKQGLTMTGATIGTPTYMSPEQCNALPITGASDQYSLGVMAYEMLTGKTLFDGDSVMTIMFKHVHEEPPPVAEFPEGVDPDLAEAVRRMLAKAPEDRFPDMEGVAAAFHSTLAPDSAEKKALVGFAMKGENRTILAQVKTPRSPFPSAGHARPKTAAKTAHRTQPGSGEATMVMGGGPKKSRLPLIAAIAALVIGGGGAGWYFTMGPGAAQGPTAVASQPPAQQLPEAAPAQAPAQTDPVTAQPQPQTPPPQQAAPVQQPQRPAGPAPVAQVQLLGAPGGMQTGQTAQLTANPVAANGQALAGRAVSFTSSNPSAVTVSAAGLLTAVAPGTAVITASSEGRTAQATVVVSAETVAAIALAQSSVQLETGATAQLQATVTGSGGGTIQRPIAWSSSNPAVASVNPDGLVSGVGAGQAQVTANAEGRTATATVTVTRRELTEAEHRQLITQAIQDYGQALQAKDIDGVRRVYPGLTSQRESQLRQALPNMENLAVTLNVGGVRISGATATATVTGQWAFSSGGRAQTLPANNTYTLRRDGERWVITDIQ